MVRRGVQWAEAADVLAAAREWSEGQKACRRNNNHHWQDLDVEPNARLRFQRVVQRCGQCGNHRWKEINFNGEDLCGWRSDPLPTYGLPPGTGRMGADARNALKAQHYGRSRRGTAQPRSGVTRRILGVEE